MHPAFHISLLQSYSIGGATLGPPDPILTAGEEEEYKLESILKHQRHGQATEYLVHGYSYDEAENIWVSEQDLVHPYKVI